MDYEEYFGITYEKDNYTDQFALVSYGCYFSSSSDYGKLFNNNIYIPYSLDKKLREEQNFYINNKNCFTQNNNCSNSRFTQYVQYKDNKLFFSPRRNNNTTIGSTTMNNVYFPSYLVVDLNNYTYYFQTFTSKQKLTNTYQGIDYNNKIVDTLHCGYNSQVGNTVDNWNTHIKIGSSYVDDLIYTSKSSDILIYSAYLIIPILIVLFLIKVFRKGIH